jgi:tagatose-6-phosphate ketose/aldose isomerase
LSDVKTPFRFDPNYPGAEWTIREIGHQSEVWGEVADIVTESKERLESFLAPILAHDDVRIILTGAGTSAFVGEIAAPALSKRLGKTVEAIASTDLVSSPSDYFAEDRPTLLVSFARSGNSPESVAATSLATDLLSDIHHLIVTCDASGALARHHDGRSDSNVVLMPERANDRSFAMTSSFSSMLLAALLVLGGSGTDLVEPLSAAAAKLFQEWQGPLRELAHSGYERVVYLGSGTLKGLARESALKLLELTAGQVVTYFDSSLGFRHGPKAVLNDQTLVIVYLSADPYTRLYDLDLVAELRSTQPAGSVQVVSAGPVPDADDSSWEIDGLQGIPDEFLAVVFISVAQILGLSFALQIGTTPDNPFPSGDVNRVVTGVTVYPFVDDERVDG